MRREFGGHGPGGGGPATHARAGLPGITAHTWLEANPLPDDLRAIPLVDPVIEHTIGLVTSSAVERTPVISELVGLLQA